MAKSTKKLKSRLIPSGSLSKKISKWEREYGTDANIAYEEFTKIYGTGEKGGRKINNISKLKPGKVYFLNYNHKFQKALEKDGSFHDSHPLFLMVKKYKAKTGNLVMMGLNLGYLPPYVRQELLKSIYSKWKAKYDEEGTTGKNVHITSGNNFYHVLSQLMKKFEHDAFKFAIRSYICDMQHIQSCRMVAFADWTKVSLMNMNEIVGMFPEEVYEQYQIARWG